MTTRVSEQQSKAQRTRLPADVAYAAQRILRVRRKPGRYALRFVVDERGIVVEEIAILPGVVD